MNFLDIWVMLASGTIGGIVIILLNIVPVIIVRNGFRDKDRVSRIAGYFLGSVLYSLEIAIVLQVLFGRV